MALRYPKPLNAKEWEKFVENLRRGPTPKQVAFVKESEKWDADINALEEDRSY